MNKEIQTLLASKKNEEIEKGLGLFEKKGSLKELPLVCDLLNHENADIFEAKVIETISNIKVSEANLIIIDAIQKDLAENGNLRALLQICWQSQLDFTQHLALFTDIFLEGDYLTSLEAFTVIENIWIDHNYENDHKELLLDKVKEQLGKMEESKVILAKELILVLEA